MHVHTNSAMFTLLLRMASNAARKQGSIIGPKEPTHEDLRRSFVDYFTKKLRQHKRLNISKQIGSTIVKVHVYNYRSIVVVKNW